MLKTALLSIALVAGGCFTTAGAISGGAVAASKIKDRKQTSYGGAVATGALLGLMVDAALLVAVTSSLGGARSEPTSTWDCWAYCYADH